MLSPKRIKYRKPHRRQISGRSYRGSSSRFGDYGLRSIQPALLTSRQIEASRRVMTRYVRRGGKLWIRVFPDKVITKRAAETRIGSGKGIPDHWAAAVYPNIMLFELRGIQEAPARQAIQIAASKLPIKTQFAILST